ncbi:ABC-2 type transport system permease protein [Actinoplanes octamycinicus]|uniref:ABC-2 type transport system permease protein n=1 Tax=Actinoplanes octamycinicus TaxID=135948 RepID=A0A7W7M8Q2_9ACTN|nr:hypothetical protein [Actinoplanes octamycinicus]MBB4741183.1 ABC-2 type transport system permease protein [Actinoplanes octamycinicus]GIE56089.1 hypothetical protein Aoc01nite_14910 [Actinoplanes octamycinicus]
MTGIAAAELTKIRTLPAAGAAVLAALLANALLGWFAAGTPTARIGTLMLAPAYLFLAAPVLAAGSEHRAGQLRISLLAAPSRHRWFGAKSLVVTVVSAVAAVVVVLPGYVLQHGAASTVTGAAARVLGYLLLGLIGFGLAAAARSVVTPLVVLVTLPVLLSPILRGLLPGVVRLLPHEATLSLVGLAAPAALTGPAGLAVSAGWAVLAVGAGWLTTAVRDS